MSRFVKLSTVLLAFVALAPMGASARPVVKTNFDLYNAHLRHSPFHFAIYGRLHSPKHACIVHRRVELYFKRGDKMRLRDAGRTSRNGAIALKDRARVHPDRFILKVRQTRIAGRRYTCGPWRWDHRLR
jgi:hypothetical protein